MKTMLILLLCQAIAGGGDVRTIQREATFSTNGLEGTIRSWARADGAYRVESAAPAAGYSSVEVYDGKRGWSAQGGTRAHEVTELELAGLISDAYFESLKTSAAAVPASAPNTFEVTPPGGLKVTVEVDPETCLPRSYKRTTAIGLTTTTIEEWTTVDGIRLPARVRQSTGDPKYDLTIRYTSTKLNEPAAATLFARPAAANPVRLPNRTKYLELPMELTSHHIYIPVQLAKEKRSWFVLDTGADGTVIDAGRAKDLGLTGAGSLEARGTGENTIEAQLIAKPPLRVAGLQMPLETMYAVDLRAIWPRGGRAMEGILGHDVLSHFVVEIDYAASRVRLHDPERFTAPSGATAFPFTYEGNVPAIRMALELPGGRRVEGRMIVDTGNSGGVDLYGPFVEQHGIRAAIGKTIEGPGGMGVGGVSKQDLGRAAAFHLGPFALKSPVITLSRDAKGSAAHPELAGNLGGRVLRRFRVFVDYANDRILLEPNKLLDAPFEYDMSGLALIAEGEAFERVIVRRVQPETPGAAAGFLDGDQLIAIDGSKVTLQQARELFAIDGKTYAVRVRRGAEEVTLKLTTRRMI
jgi:hypothetical protein